MNNVSLPSGFEKVGQVLDFCTWSTWESGLRKLETTGLPPVCQSKSVTPKAPKVKESNAKMEIKKAKFLKSSQYTSQLPAADKPEFAFVGRSNVGKSSLINMLVRSKLAMTSASPGKTRLINHYDVDGTWYLVDLPGYGYARVSKSDRKDFEGMIHEFATKRKNLVAVLVLVDGRHAPMASDLEFMEFLGLSEVPFAVVFTKADKMGPVAMQRNVDVYKQELLKTWEELPPMFVTSSEKKQGRAELLNWIGQGIAHYRPVKETPSAT